MFTYYHRVVVDFGISIHTRYMFIDTVLAVCSYAELSLFNKYKMALKLLHTDLVDYN